MRVETTVVKTCIIERISVLGINVNLFTDREFIDFLTASACQNKKTRVAYANISEINLAHEIPEHRDFLNSAEAVFLDGFGLLLAAHLLGYAVSRAHRLTGPEFLDPLVLKCAEKKLSVYVLAGEPSVLSAALERMHAFAPSLKVDGHHGFFGKSGPENEAVIDDINRTKPDILYVGFGSPAQEKWITDNIERVNARVFLPMGAGLDYYTGTKRRGPKWLTDYGAEWVCRLIAEPKRLWKRYIVGNPRFFLRIARCMVLRASHNCRRCVYQGSCPETFKRATH